MGESRALLSRSADLLRLLGQKAPGLWKFCEAIRLHCCSRGSYKPVFVHDSPNADLGPETIDFFLVICQDISGALCEEPRDVESRAVRLKMATNVRFSRLLHPVQALERLQKLLHSQRGCPEEVVRAQLSAVSPFVGQYVDLFKVYLAEELLWTKSLFRLAYVAGRIFREVLSKGFCRPTDNDTSTEDGGSVEASDGLGLGHGEGKEDVSKQMEDEDQFEGLKGEDEGSAKGDEGDDAHDVDFDLGGSLEDGPELDVASDDDNDFADIDDEFDAHGDGDESHAVDEDFWNKDGNDDQGEHADKIAKEEKSEAIGEVNAKENETGDSMELSEETRPQEEGEPLPDPADDEEMFRDSLEIEDQALPPTEDLVDESGLERTDASSDIDDIGETLSGNEEEDIEMDADEYTRQDELRDPDEGKSGDTQAVKPDMQVGEGEGEGEVVTDSVEAGTVGKDSKDRGQNMMADEQKLSNEVSDKERAENKEYVLS